MKRILIVRTDRLGDVVLSTPIIKAVRSAYPKSFISMMVAPHARDIVEGNPNLNSVVQFDKKKDKGFFGTLRISVRLRRMKIDTVLVLHPTVRVHLIMWLAGIKKRVGYDRKWGFLLTDKAPHKKELGEKHEIEYSFDILNLAGIKTNGHRHLFVPVKPRDKKSLDTILDANGFGIKKDLVVIHPGASCPSKRWSSDKFARVADEVIKRFNKKVIIVAGDTDLIFGRTMRDYMQSDALDLSGDLSVGELIALMSRARLLISNDSGPVHIAAALGVPCVVIFGRKQAGLSFKRWGPVGKNDAILHRDVGCIECLAHMCKKGFKCLAAVEPEEVIEAAGRLLHVTNV